MITGWVARLYPYLADITIDVPNPVLDHPMDATPGIRSTSVPGTLARVIVNVNDGDIGRVAVHAGLVAVAQDPDGALRPVAGWHVTRAELPLDDVIDRLAREHETTPPAGTHGEAPVEVIALYHRIGSATLFGGRWRVPPWDERRHAGVPELDDSAQTLIEMADGRSIIPITVFGSWSLTTHWALARVEDGRIAGDPAHVPLLGTSLALLLDAALDSGGEVAHLETGRLSAL